MSPCPAPWPARRRARPEDPPGGGAPSWSPLVVFAIFIGFWYFMSYVGMSEHRRFLVPPPHAVIEKSFLPGPDTLGDIAEPSELEACG